MYKRYLGLASALCVGAIALGSCGTTEPEPNEIPALHIKNTGEGSDVWLTYSQQNGWGIVLAEQDVYARFVDGAIGPIESAQSAGGFGDLLGDGAGSGGGSTAPTFSGTVDTPSLSGSSQGESTFSGGSAGNSTFSGSSQLNTTFSGGFGSGAGGGGSCDLTRICDIFGPMILSESGGQVDSSAFISECKREIASAPFPPELEPLFCVLLDFMECMLDGVSPETLFSGDEAAAAQFEQKALQCYPILERGGLLEVELF